MSVTGIDPGMATGGMVDLAWHGAVRAVQRLGVAAKAVRVPEDRHADRQFTAACMRAAGVIATVTATLELWKPELVVIESFVDLPGKAQKATKATKGAQPGHMQLRWTTPLVIGGLVGPLAAMGYRVEDNTLRFQNPAVLRQFRDEIPQLAAKKRGDVLVEQDMLLTSDHLVKAWCHAEYARIRRTFDTAVGSC